MSGADGLSVATPILFGKDSQVAGILMTQWTAAPTLLATRQQSQMTFLVSAVVLLALLGLNTLLLRRLLGKPLEDLDGTIRAIAKGDYDCSVPGAQLGNEFGRIATRLMSMRDSLKDARDAHDLSLLNQERERAVMASLSNSLNALAKGQLGWRIQDAFPERFEALKRDFNDTTLRLHETMVTVVDTAIAIREESDGIHEHSLQLAKRTENQAATLEETVAALGELTESIKVVADDARAVESIVGVAKSEAERGGEVVEQAISAMSKIEGSSEKISTIISVIDDIAFQTNLLALNAGVEAARAGEAGRGFAVVASEVRALAQRSSQAAGEIKELIVGSADQVAQGVDLVGRTGEALHDISKRVAESAELMSKMADGAVHQSRSLGEINIGMTQLDQATQRNAGMVEQSGIAYDSLRKQSHKLSELVGHFDLTESREGPAPDPDELTVSDAA